MEIVKRMIVLLRILVLAHLALLALKITTFIHAILLRKLQNTLLCADLLPISTLEGWVLQQSISI